MLHKPDISRVSDNPDFGNQKIIQFTVEGERLISCARQHFADLDKILENRFGKESLDAMSAIIENPRN